LYQFCQLHTRLYSKYLISLKYRLVSETSGGPLVDLPDVRYGSKADVTLLNFDVRFTPESGQRPHGIYEYTPYWFCGPPLIRS
jgi:hypothetical protein